MSNGAVRVSNRNSVANVELCAIVKEEVEQETIIVVRTQLDKLTYFPAPPPQYDVYKVDVNILSVYKVDVNIFKLFPVET